MSASERDDKSIMIGCFLYVCVVLSAMKIALALSLIRNYLSRLAFNAHTNMIRLCQGGLYKGFDAAHTHCTDGKQRPQDDCNVLSCLPHFDTKHALPQERKHHE